MEIKNNYTNSQKIKYKSPATPSFQGITSKLSKAVYDKNEVYEFCNKYGTKFNGIVGKPPAAWVFSIPFDKRPEKIKELYANFGKIFSELRDPVNVSQTRRSAQKKLKRLLKQTDIVKNQKQVKLSYTDSGSFGDVYRLDVKDESFAVKVYRALFQTGWTYHNCNGNFFEQPVAQYLKKKMPNKNNNWFKFYFGDLYNGIMVSRFENGDYPFDGKAFNTLKIGIVTTKEHYSQKNILEGRILDVGMVNIWPHAKNKTLRYVYSKTMKDQQAPFKVLEKTLKWKPSNFYNERLKGVFYSLQIVSNENAKKCLDLLLPAADKDVSLYIADNIFYAPYALRQEIFDSLIAKNNEEVDMALAKNLECIEGVITPESKTYKILYSRNNKNINARLKKLY